MLSRFASQAKTEQWYQSGSRSYSGVGKGTIRCYGAEQGSHSFSILPAVVIKLQLSCAESGSLCPSETHWVVLAEFIDTIPP